MRCVPKDLLAKFNNKQVFQVFYVQITKDTTVGQNFVQGTSLMTLFLHSFDKITDYQDKEVI